MWFLTSLGCECITLAMSNAAIISHAHALLLFLMPCNLRNSANLPVQNEGARTQDNV